MENNYINFIYEEYKEYLKYISEEEGIEAITYGIRCKNFNKGISYDGIIGLSEKEENNLKFINRQTKQIFTLELLQINNIEFKKESENLSGYKEKSTDESFFQIFEKDKIYDFSFRKKWELIYFLKGLLSKIRKKKISNLDFFEKDLANIMESYNLNFDNHLDKEEFNNFAKENGIDPDFFFIKFDTNNSQTITKDEIIRYYQNQFSGEQFRDIFNKYSNDKIYLKPEEMQLLFKEVQKEPINILEAYILTIKFTKDVPINLKRKVESKIQKKYIKNRYQITNDEVTQILQKINKTNSININNLKLRLNEFYILLNSFFLTIYNNKLIKNELDLGRNLVDYFIKSSHNTYLTGHQLKGDSSIYMYQMALLNGYRLIELDCYNGEGDKIEVTHGFTLAGKIYLVDILKTIKEYSFINSHLPVILSIENHLDKKHQEIMAKNFEEILVDLYIFPNDRKPEYLPSLKDLQNKSIIFNRRKQ